jgi:hypothetical protein
LNPARHFLVAVTAAAITLSTASAAPAPYVIPVILNGTGANAYAGQTETAALHVFELYENKHGGLNGRPIHFEIYDDQTEPRVAVQLANQVLAANPKPIVVLGQLLLHAGLFAQAEELRFLRLRVAREDPTGSDTFRARPQLEAHRQRVGDDGDGSGLRLLHEICAGAA